MYPTMFMGGYGLYFLFALPALLFGMWAQFRVKSTFSQYSQVRNLAGITGAQVARRILDLNSLQDVSVEQTGGMLSDNYDPRSKVLRLSADVYQGISIASAGVAAHETGHALQDQAGYAPLQLRSLMVPAVQIGSWLGPIIFLVGLFMAGVFGTTLAWVGLGLFGATALFALVTLPVELDASRRAREMLANTGLIYNDEMHGVSSVLNAAALTYVAAAMQAISTLLYYAFLLLGAGSRRR
ncbi:MAG: zinc metallopeptidase [Anaerolineaceae bacterium]|nr:zinc metallopeptidase [Anaerolineaceae bacterium]